MARNQDLDYLVILAMLLSGLYVALSGLTMDFFGLQRVWLHQDAGYAFVALAALHLALNWRPASAYLRRRFTRSRGQPASPYQQPAPGLGRRGLLVSALAALGGFMLGRLIPGWRPLQLPGRATAQPALQADLGQFYHQWSKPGSPLSRGTALDWGAQPERYKRYPQAKRVVLPAPGGHPGLSLEEAIQRRRSLRDYSAGTLSLLELARLLHAAQGITAPTQGLRAAPSAGALYPIETYAVVHEVAGLEAGLYHYAVADHQLEQLHVGDLRTPLVVAGIGQEMLGRAPVCFVLTAIFQRTRWKYRERAYRYVLLEAGHIGQNLYLAATSMRLGACAVGAFLDDELNRLLGLDGEQEAALYLIAVGKT